MREKLCQVNWSPLFHSQSCDDQFLFFTDNTNEIIETSLPLRRVKADSSDKPWITPEIKTLIAKRQRAWSRGNDFAFKRYRNMVNAQCKKARNSYVIIRFAAAKKKRSPGLCLSQGLLHMC